MYEYNTVKKYIRYGVTYKTNVRCEWSKAMRTTNINNDNKRSLDDDRQYSTGPFFYMKHRDTENTPESYLF